MNWLNDFWTSLLNTPAVETIAVISGIAYVILAALRMISCWVFAFISSALYVYICLDYQLYIESVLQLFFVVMAVVGWYGWRAQSELKKNSNDLLDSLDNEASEIRTWGWQLNALNILASGLVVIAVGWAFDTFSNQANPYMDAFTTIFSLVATFMVTQKVVENWVYWVVIDCVAIALYASRGLYLTSLLYGFFTILAIFGFFAWYKQFKLQKQ